MLALLQTTWRAESDIYAYAREGSVRMWVRLPDEDNVPKALGYSPTSTTFTSATSATVSSTTFTSPDGRAQRMTAAAFRRRAGESVGAQDDRGSMAQSSVGKALGLLGSVVRRTRSPDWRSGDSEFDRDHGSEVLDRDSFMVTPAPTSCMTPWSRIAATR